MHALARRHLEQVEDPVAVAEAVEEHRHRAQIEGGGAQPDQVRVEPVELHVDDAQILGARRDLEVEHLLDAAAEGLHVEEVGEVVHPLDERDRLPIRLVLAVLLDARVDVSHDRLEVDHGLALERDEEAKDAVGRGVMRAEVDRHQLLLELQCFIGAGALDDGGANYLGGGARDYVAAVCRRRAAHAVARAVRAGSRWRGRFLFVAQALVRLAHAYHPGTSRSVLVKITGSPPIGKSRRCGQPT